MQVQALTSIPVASIGAIIEAAAQMGVLTVTNMDREHWQIRVHEPESSPARFNDGIE